MTQTLQNSYLQRYEQRQSKDNSPLATSAVKSPPHDSPSLPSVVSKLAERVDGIEVKLTSLVNVVKLLQRYTETRDDQYEKEKENQLIRKGSDLQKGKDEICKDCVSVEARAREFQLLARQFREEIRSVQKIKGGLVIGPPLKESNNTGNIDVQAIEMRLREEINKKMEICMQLISQNSSVDEAGLAERVDSLAFDLNQLEHQCKRGRLALEQDVDRIEGIVGSRQGVRQKEERSRPKNDPSPSPISRKGSKSDKSLSKGKVKTGASRVREDEMKEALRKKRQHRQRLKARNH